MIAEFYGRLLSGLLLIRTKPRKAVDAFSSHLQLPIL